MESSIDYHYALAICSALEDHWASAAHPWPRLWQVLAHDDQECLSEFAEWLALNSPRNEVGEIDNATIEDTITRFTAELPLEVIAYLIGESSEKPPPSPAGFLHSWAVEQLTTETVTE